MDWKSEMSVEVSVIMPSYNVAEYYTQCMESVVGQSMKNIEIICVDAGSTDGTREIIMHFAKSDSRIVFVESEKRSYGYQVNVGISLAKGKYVAIVETDDYINRDMIKILYDAAQSNDYDYIKADYDEFYVLSNEDELHQTVTLPKELNHLYGRCVCPMDYPELFDNDVFLWKGLYKKEFLLSNAIKLSETPGAAFQDSGFTQLVFSAARRALYLPTSLYNYRRGREGASVNSSCMLRYNYQEERRLLDNHLIELPDDSPYWKGFYRKMVLHFIVSVDNDLMGRGFTLFELDKEAYEWYCRNIIELIERGKVDEKLIGNKAWDKLCVLLRDKKQYYDNMMQKNTESLDDERRLLDAIPARNEVYIFGVGARGKRALLFLDGKRSISAFVDNNREKQGGECAGYQIIGPSKCCIEDDKTWLVANRFNQEEIVEQLLNMGVSSEDIVVF